LFICLDNINWADDASLELLHYLIRTLKDSPVFFFLVYRVEEAKDSSFQKVLQLMSREGLYNNIGLDPLKTVDVARMLSFIIDSNPSVELTDYIFKETGGNPFFIEELMKSLETNDAIVWEDNKWIFDKDKKVIIPYSLEGVVERKLGMMNSEAHSLLEYAAVIGREFDFSFLQDITKMNEGQLFDLMDEILEMRLLKESGGECYRFTEAIIREIIYQKIPGVKLKHYHQTVGEELLSIYKDNIESIIEELAHHFYLSKDRDRAIEYSVLAGDRAKDAYANQDAIRFYTRVIEYLRDKITTGVELREIECLRKRAVILNLVGKNEKALVDLETAVNKAKRINNKKEEANCLIEFCKIHQDSAQYNEAKKKAKISLEIFQELNERKGEAQSLNNIGSVYDDLSEYSTALEFYKRSLKIVEEIGDRKDEAKTLNNIGTTHWYLGGYSTALEFYQRSLKIVDEIGDRKDEAKILNNIGIVNNDLGEYSTCLEFFKRSLKIIEEIGDRKDEAKILNNIGVIHRHLGKYTEALKFYKRSLKIIEEIGTRKYKSGVLHNIGIIHCHLGEYSTALEFYERSLKIRKELADRQGEAETLSSIGNVFLEVGNFTKAKRYFNNAYSIAREIKSKPLLADVSLGLTSVYIEKNNLKKANTELKQVSSLAEELTSKGIKAEALCLSGRLHTKGKEWNEAKTSFEQSISLLKKIKNKIELAKVYYYQSLMFKDYGDKTNAKEAFTKAMKFFKEIGSKGWIKKIKEDSIFRQ
ncbi:tetratricopeptide repeat protein, partial [candidate division WOR-3 bacterium]|nr:tetratricopeptide repeat protein [candidate division WOR-3 bacterium]